MAKIIPLIKCTNSFIKNLDKALYADFNLYIFARKFLKPNTKQMKKSIGILLGTAMLGMIACGPSAEEQAAEAKRIADSTSQAMTDSLNKAKAEADAAMKATEDSLKMVAMQDSINALNAEAEKKAKAATTKPKTTKPKTEPNPTDPTKVKPGQGRG